MMEKSRRILPAVARMLAEDSRMFRQSGSSLAANSGIAKGRFF
jgi:hypothetical protein